MFFVIVTLLAIFCRGGNGGTYVWNTAKYDKGHLMLLPCKSLNFSLLLCSTNSSLPFASHILPDGSVLDLCLESADGTSFTSSVPDIYAGLEVIEVERKLVGNGAHRELKTLLTARLEKFEECHIVIVERLSSGVFVDMFELQGLVAHAVFDAAALYGDHNLELPALHSFESMVVVHTRVKSKPGHPFQAQLSLPLHARYPPLSLGSHVMVNIKFPHLLLQCFWSGGSASTSHSDSLNMSWAILTMKDSSLLNSTQLQWLVPAGKIQHTGIVAAVTAFFSIVGVVTLWLVSMFSYNSCKVKVT